MKYDVLSSFKEFLIESMENKNTAERYYFAVDNLFKGLQFSDFSEIPKEEIESRLSRITTKNNFSAAKNGLLRLQQFSAEAYIPDNDFFKKNSMDKRNRSKKPKKTIYLDKMNRKINALQNKKFALAYRLMEKTGARVSEVSLLQKQDISIVDDEITVNILHGKGGSNGEITVRDKYLAEKLTLHLDDIELQEKPFYSASSMKKKAGELGLECHDFRRVAAIQHRKEQLAQGVGFEEANDNTRLFLRHARFSTTKRYLFNRKLEIKEESKGEDEE